MGTPAPAAPTSLAPMCMYDGRSAALRDFAIWSGVTQKKVPLPTYVIVQR